MEPITYATMLGPVLGQVLDIHQWDIETKGRRTFETAIEVMSEENKKLEMYPTEKGMILKLVVDGKCTRQMRVGNSESGGVSHPSIAKAMQKLGFQNCQIADATKALVKYCKTLQAEDIDGPTVVMKSEAGKLCRFKILGGMWRPGQSKVRIWSDDFDKTVLLDGPEARKIALPFVLHDHNEG